MYKNIVVSSQNGTKAQLKDTTLFDFFQKSVPSHLLLELREVTNAMEQQALEIWGDNPIPKLKDMEMTKMVGYYLTIKKHREEIKKQLPSITLSCQLPEGSVKNRTIQKIIEYNGIFQYDIDGKENKGLNLQKTIDLLLVSPSVLAAYISPSGNGVKAIIATTNTDASFHAEAWKQVKKNYYYVGVIPDEGVGKNAVIPLFASDHTGIDFSRFDTVVPLEIDATIPIPTSTTQPFHLNQREKDEKTIKSILAWQQATGTSVLNVYGEWVSAGLALRDAVPNAKDVWHEMSSYYVGYTHKEAEEVWERIQRKNQTGTPVTIGTIVALAIAKGYSPTSTQKKTPNTISVQAANANANTATNIDDDYVPYDASDFDFETSTKYERLMNFMFTYFDIRYNIVSNEIEMSKKNKHLYKVMPMDKVMHEALKKGFSGIKDMLKPLLSCEHVMQHDPLIAYFENLPPYSRTEPDYIAMIGDYVKCEKQAFFIKHLKKHLMRTVATATGITPFNKHCLTLFGEQNDGKTSFCRWLQPPALAKYFAQPKKIIDKDGLFTLCENLLVLFDDLDTLSGKEIGQIKSIFSESVIKERPPYGTTKVSFNRRCSFLATTNVVSLLTDTTGNVRWLVIKVNEILHDEGGPNGYESIPIDRVWAQALYHLKNGEPHRLTPEEISESELNNETFTETTVEEDLISQYFYPSKKKGEGEFWSSTEILLYLREMANGLLLNSVTIGKILRKQGFVYEKTAFKRGYWIKMNVKGSDSNILSLNTSDTDTELSNTGLTNLTLLNYTPEDGEEIPF